MDSNPYYSPEKMGLQIVAELDVGGAWDFDSFVVWSDVQTGELLWAHDSGCSCPTPFEYMDRESMEPLANGADLRRLESALADRIRARGDKVSLADGMDMMKKVRAALVKAAQR